MAKGPQTERRCQSSHCRLAQHKSCESSNCDCSCRKLTRVI